MPSAKNCVVGLVGVKYAGKTTQLERLAKLCPRLVLYDTSAEHSWTPNSFSDVGELEGFLRRNGASPTFAARFVSEEEEPEEEFSRLADAVFEEGALAFVIEELPTLAQPGYMPTGLKRTVRLGRHAGPDRDDIVNLAYTGHRFSEIPRQLTAQTDYFFLMRQNEPRDLDLLEERTGRDVRERVEGLAEHGLVVFDVAARGIVSPGEATRVWVERQPQLGGGDEGEEPEHLPWWNRGRRFVIRSK
jgi:hypothetical protein